MEMFYVLSCERAFVPRIVESFGAKCFLERPPQFFSEREYRFYLPWFKIIPCRDMADGRDKRMSGYDGDVCWECERKAVFYNRPFANIFASAKWAGFHDLPLLNHEHARAALLR